MIVNEAGVKGGTAKRRVPQQALQKGDVHRHAVGVDLRQGALQPAGGVFKAARRMGGDELGQQRVEATAGRVAGVAERIHPTRPECWRR